MFYTIVNGGILEEAGGTRCEPFLLRRPACGKLEYNIISDDLSKKRSTYSRSSTLCVWFKSVLICKSAGWSETMPVLTIAVPTLCEEIHPFTKTVTVKQVWTERTLWHTPRFAWPGTLPVNYRSCSTGWPLDSTVPIVTLKFPGCNISLPHCFHHTLPPYTR